MTIHEERKTMEKDSVKYNQRGYRLQLKSYEYIQLWTEGGKSRVGSDFNCLFLNEMNRN